MTDDIHGRLEVHERRMAAIERRLANMLIVGPVAQRDHAKGVRIRLGGTDEAPWLSPWIQPGDKSGVSRYLPDIGAQMLALSPSGDHEQGMAIDWTHSDAKPNPAASADETVFYDRNGVRFSEQGGTMTLTASTVLIKCGGSTFQVTGQGIKAVADDYDFG